MNVFKIFFLLFLFFALVAPPNLVAEMLSIKGNAVNMRKGAGTNFSILWQYGDGFPLQVIEQVGDWLLVEDFEKDRGWIHSSVVEKTPHMIVKANKNNNGAINIRQEPSTSATTVAQAKYGVVFKRVTQKNGWVKVVHEEKNIEGWIKRNLLWGF